MQKDSKNPENLDKTLKTQSKPIDKGRKESEEGGIFAGKDAERHEESKKTAHFLFIIGLHVLFWMAVIVLLLRTSHLVLPAGLVWLEETLLNTIDKVLGAAVGGGLIGKYLQKIFPEKTSSK